MATRKLEDEKVKVSFSKIQNTHRRIVDALSPYSGSTLTSDTINSATVAMAFSLPKTCIEFVIAQGMLLKYLRQPITLKDINGIADRISGNLDALMVGTPVGDSDWRIRSDWGLIQILEAERASRTFKDGTSQNGAWLELQVITGPACTIRYRKFWSSDMLSYGTYRMGFTRNGEKSRYPLLDVAQMTNLYFLGFFDHLAIKDRADYTKFLCTEYLQSKNRELLRKRLRAIHRDEEFKCPRGFPLNVNCHRCPVGLDECEAAIHPRTYVESECPVCKRASWMDPGKPDKCIECRAASVLRVVSP